MFCGFGGDDYIYKLDEGDVFIGGEGTDRVRDILGTATFYGGEGNDEVVDNYYGTVDGVEIIGVS